MGFRMAYVHLAMAHTNDQGQDHYERKEIEDRDILKKEIAMK